MNGNATMRRIAVIIAVIAVILVLLYLGGIISQLTSGYQNWLQQDGYSGGTEMESVNFAFLYCMGKAFTKEGLIGMLFIAVAIVGLFIFVKMHNRFGSKDADDRNFTRSKSGVYGTAGWMTLKEMKTVLEVASPENARGIILGQKNGSVICLPENTRLNKHLCVFGASGTMKSRAIIRPYLFQSIKRGESVVITDPKGELYIDTAEMFRRNGYTVRVFNLVNPEHSDSWNCMADLDGDTMMAQILTNVIISNTGKGRPDHFWDNGEGNLLKSLILYIDQDSTRSPEAKHLPAVYQMLTQNNEKTLSAIFDKLPISHPAKAPYSLFAQGSDTVRTGIVGGLGTRLQVMQNEAIKNITSKSELDLTEPGKTKCAYFVILSDQESSTEFISSLFFSILFIKLGRFADSLPDQRCKVPVNIVFDEFNNVGQLDTYPRRLSVLRSRAVQVCHVVQSLAQFKNRYPDEQWAEIIGNCDTQIMLGCTEEQTAEYFSARSGDMTVDINSTMTVKKTIAVAQLIPQYRHTEGMGKRRLLTTDEVFRLPNDEMLIILRGEKVLRANKFDYIGHPYAKKIVRTSVMDYDPLYKQSYQTETEFNPDMPEYNSDNNKPFRSQTENKKPVNPPFIDLFYQTETESDLDTSTTGSNGYVHAENSPVQHESDIAGEATLDLTVRHQTNQAIRQTDSKNNRKKVSRPTINQFPEADYVKLLESFKPQSNKKAKQSKKDSETDTFEESALNNNETDALNEHTSFDTDEEDTGTQDENVPIYQTEIENDFSSSTEVDFDSEVLDSASAGDDNPPDDF